MESMVYGSSRIGSIHRNQVGEPTSIGQYFGYNRGNKFYEISNHLGNVLTVINDKKDGVENPSNSSRYGYYTPQIVSASHYYPFGWISRSFDVGPYRYGFNGKERDDDVKKSDGSQYDYGMRIYDPRAGRFLSVDPLTKGYPALTPYQYSSNRPIDGIDIDGLEFLSANSSMYRQKHEKGTVINTTYDRYTVQIVYENVPHAIKDPVTKGIGLTNGGPVTAFGRDWNANTEGAYFSKEGRYYNKGPKFIGLADEDDNSPDPSNSTKGLWSMRQSPSAIEENDVAASRFSSGIEAGKQAFGIGQNISNVDIWNAKAKEGINRRAFYRATNIVDAFFKHIEEGALKNGQGRVDLINFITDGYLPNNKPTKDLSKSELEYNLKVIYTGIQLIYKNEDIGVTRETSVKFAELLKDYKEKGGTSKFEKIYDLKRKK
jgi:RHS repeat-associated protein